MKYMPYIGAHRRHRDFTHNATVFQSAYTCAPIGNAFPKTIQEPKGPNSNAEHFLVHSQLLKESCFVSVPPPTYMLKFSRYQCSTSNQVHTAAVPNTTSHYEHLGNK